MMYVSVYVLRNLFNVPCKPELDSQMCIPETAFHNPRYLQYFTITNKLPKNKTMYQNHKTSV